MHLSIRNLEREAARDGITRVDPYAMPYRPARETAGAESRAGKAAKVATRRGTRARAMMDDRAPLLLSKCRTAASIQLRADRADCHVMDAADAVYMALIERARRENAAAGRSDWECADWPRADWCRMMSLRREVGRWAKRELARRHRELVSTSTDWDALAAVQAPAETAPATALPPAAAEREARDACALLREPAGGDVYALLYGTLREADAATVAGELQCTSAALLKRYSRARAILARLGADGLATALLLRDDAAGSEARHPHGATWREAAILNDPAVPADWGERTSGPCGEVHPGTAREPIQLRLPIRADWETVQEGRIIAAAAQCPRPCPVPAAAHPGQLDLALAA